MKILIIQSTNPQFKPIMDVTDRHLEQIKTVLPGSEIQIVNDTENLQTIMESVDMVITPNINLIPLPYAKNLKWMQVTSAGVNGLPSELINNDIIITNASGVHPIPIAEHVMTFMLTFSHQFHTLHRTQIEKKTWDYAYQKYPIQELYGKTIGITGVGRIGSHIAKLAKALGMHVIAMVRDTSKKYHDVDELIMEKDIAIMLKRSDFVVNAMPLTPATHHFFDMQKFQHMKKTAYFINIGRGPVAEEKDLIAALEIGMIAGAGLDVFEEEPLSQKSPLWNMKNVLITPHSSGSTPEYMNRVIDIFCENLKAYLDKKQLPNLVDKKRGY
ncbi:MAG: D-2-hydroxyacid dehydrogenase [Candidatus Levybacteria bacterium]|nr:D-2-hydroxyacid dehydrogenase [Candidatus Levybacteria bacterium]